MSTQSCNDPRASSVPPHRKEIAPALQQHVEDGLNASMSSGRAPAAGEPSRALPITQHLPTIRETLVVEDIIIVSSETGSGKSTQIPQELARAGYRVFCTQPTRIAATSLQSEVERQFGGSDGERVGYKHGRGELIGTDAQIMYCSDGLLLERVLTEQYFKKYAEGDYNDVLIIDECHTFNPNIELLLSLYKKYRSLGKVPKLVVMSATINTEELANFLEDSPAQAPGCHIPIFNISGRPHSITHLQRGASPEQDAADQIAHGRGDVIDFLPGVGEIREAHAKLKKLDVSAEVVELHGKLSQKEQKIICEPSSLPRVILSSPVAEQSITIPSARTVIDRGLERVLTSYGDEEVLELRHSSRSTRRQREGRIGRTSDGWYINWGKPDAALCDGHWDMINGSLQGHFLRLIVAEENPLTLEFVHDPGQMKRRETIDWLRRHEYIDGDGNPTELGRFATTIPIPPRDAKIVKYALNHEHLHPELLGFLIDVAAIASVRDFRQPDGFPLANAIENDLQPLANLSENITNVAALESIYRASSSSDRRHLLADYGIREAAVDEFLFLRQEIASRLDRTLSSLGQRDLRRLPSETALTGAAQSWSDYIYRYAGRDKRGIAQYINVAFPHLPPRRLNRYAELGDPMLVSGKPFGIGLEVGSQSDSDILRLITQVTRVPSSQIQGTPWLQRFELDAVQQKASESSAAQRGARARYASSKRDGRRPQKSKPRKYRG